jgi:hypothetical protein
MSEDIASLQRQLTEAETNLRLIRERQSEFVLRSDIPLQLVKEERALVERIDRLKAQIRAGSDQVADDPPASSPPHGSATSQGDNRGQQAGVNYGTMNQYNYTYYGPPPPPDPSLPEDLPAAITLNPFGWRGRIDNPADFFDRESLLRRIFEELKRGRSLSLIGEAQIGKSSLLWMIRHLGTAKLALPPESLLHIDMQIIYSEEDFFEALCDELKIDPCRGYRLARKLRGKRYILCLDNIEKIYRDRFSSDAQGELRGLADGANTPLTLVLVSRRPLYELFPDTHGRTSPLANICNPIDVPPFTHNEAHAFLSTRLTGTGVQFSDNEIADLLEMSGRHPARLQHAAAELYHRKVQEQ